MAKYIHSKTAIVRKVAGLRTRKRVAANFKTLERIFGEFFPSFGSSLGTSYDQTSISKTNRNPSIT